MVRQCGPDHPKMVLDYRRGRARYRFDIGSVPAAQLLPDQREGPEVRKFLQPQPGPVEGVAGLTSHGRKLADLFRTGCAG